MQHLDEHTLAFHALGVEFPPSEKQTIEAHLAECSGCRSRLEELRQINDYVASSGEEGPGPESPPEALVPIPRALRKAPGSPPVYFRERPRGPVARMVTLIRRHPVATGSAAFVFAFLAFLSIQSLSPWMHPAGQPALFRINTLMTAMDVYDNSGARLWEIPLPGRPLGPDEEERLKDFSTRIVDLDGDGKLEVVTTTPYREGEIERGNVLRIFDEKGTLRFARPFGAPLSFNGSTYSGAFGLGGVVVISPPGSRQKELLVSVVNDRSPSFLARLDAKGNILGEYWHFGWLWVPRLVHLRGDGRDLVLLIGTNDVNYRSGATFPALVVLDPAMIRGQSESPRSRGFGYPPSRAELYYVRGGGVNLALVTHGKFDHPAFVEPTKMSEDSSFTVPAAFLPPDDRFQVMYTFDNTLRVRSVWMADVHMHELIDNYLKKKSPAGLNEFLLDLRKKIEYWDGTRWQKEPGEILYPLTAGNELPLPGG